MELARYST